MPKGTAKCTCRTCGISFDKGFCISGKGASKTLRERIEWAENGGIDECPDCYKARKRQEEKEKGLTCDIRLGVPYKGKCYFYAVFGGDSYSHKDDLKATGARYTEDYPNSNNPLFNALGLERPLRQWVYRSEDIEDAISFAQKFVTEPTLPSDIDIAMWRAWKQADAEQQTKAEAEKAEKEQRIAAGLAEIGDIPDWPESVKARWPEGAKWNCKIYGKKEKCIYLNNTKIPLTADEAAAMIATLKDREEWREKRDAIKKGNV